MKEIIVFGAAGGTGRQVVVQALTAGHKVTAVVRNPAAFTIKHPCLTVVIGDVFAPFSFENAIQGKDIVISCLGTQKREPTTVYSEGTGNIMKAMWKGNVNRIICISAGAVIVPPKSSFMMRFVVKNILQRIFKYAYADMRIMEQMAAASGLNWTVIRPPWLRDTAYTGRYRIAVNESLPNLSKLSRADLADFIVHHADDERVFKSIVEISY